MLLGLSLVRSYWSIFNIDNMDIFKFTQLYYITANLLNSYIIESI
jgi:hypothetical protein